jgi:hypothetical protein
MNFSDMVLLAEEHFPDATVEIDKNKEYVICTGVYAE